MVKLLFGLIIFTVVFAAFGAAALVAGVDTRDGNDWFLHRHA